MSDKPLPKRCQNAFSEIEEGRRLRPDLTQITIKEEHVLHRLVTEIDMQGGVISSSALSAQDLSVYAEGVGLPFLSVDGRESSRANCIGSISFPAGTLLGTDNFKKYGLHVIHDPFPDPDGNQHDNHVRIICTKNSTNAQAIIKVAKFHKRC